MVWRKGLLRVLARAGWPVLSLAACGERGPGPAGEGSEAAGIPPGKAAGGFTGLCVSCHGPDGEGSAELRTPSIAGLPGWYVRMQLDKFRADLRGAHAADGAGQQMHAVARTVQPGELEDLADHVEGLPVRPTRNTLGGDARRGKEIYLAGCIDCHRYDGSGEMVFRSAPLTGLQDWYLAEQLRKFRDGIRGGDPRDWEGAKMHLHTRDLSDGECADLGAYIAELAARHGTAPQEEGAQ